MALQATLLGQLNLEEHISKLPDSFLRSTSTQDPAVMSNPPFSRCVFPAPYYPDKGEGYNIPQYHLLINCRQGCRGKSQTYLSPAQGSVP